MRPDVLVLPSPLLGGTAYAPLADALTAAGASTVVAELPDVLALELRRKEVRA